MKKIVLAAAVAGFTAFTSVAQAACQEVFGLVRLDPDAQCRILAEHPGGPTFLASLGVPNSCFAVSVLGFGPLFGARGYSGLTTEVAIAPVAGGASAAPFVLNETGLPAAPNEFGLPETRRVFTARTVLITRDGASRSYTADLGVLGGGTGVEQLLITGGTGVFAGANGNITVNGNVLGSYQPFRGRVCTP